MSELSAPVILPVDNKFGFCEGVNAADTFLERVVSVARDHGIEQVYGLHAIVHNKQVTDKHEQNGVIFVDSVDEIPDNQIVVGSAHGNSPLTQHQLTYQKGATFLDAACALVKHTHVSVKRARMAAEKVLYVCEGKPGTTDKVHDEIQGTIGYMDYFVSNNRIVHAPVERAFLELNEEPRLDLLSVGGLYRIITQTTLNSKEALSYRTHIANYIIEMQPHAKVEVSKLGDVCRAVSERQQAVEQLVELKPRRLVVATDPTSKNGNSYADLARSIAPKDMTVHTVATVEEAQQLGRIDEVTALTASASTPDETTIAIAQTLGMTHAAPIERKSFFIADAQPDRLLLKISQHAERMQRSVR